jgi:hypothetical protein
MAARNAWAGPHQALRRSRQDQERHSGPSGTSVSGSVTDPAPRNLALSIAPAAVKSDNFKKAESISS